MIDGTLTRNIEKEYLVAFDRVIDGPGELQVEAAREGPYQRVENGYTAMLELKPGEHRVMDFGGSGRPLIGKLNIPDDLNEKVQMPRIGRLSLFVVIDILAWVSVALYFGAKIPGPTVRLGRVKMDFNFRDYFAASSSTGYENGTGNLTVQADQAEAMEIVPGAQEYSADANWKLFVENSIDGYHLLPVHVTYFEYL